MLTDFINTVASMSFVETGSFVLHVLLIILAFASVVLYVMAMAEWIPSGLYKKKRGADMLFEKQKTKFDYPQGRSMIYEPHGNGKEYIKRYMLFTEDGDKYLKCEFDASVESIRFELSIYDVEGKLVKAEDVYSSVEGRVYSDGYALPDEAYYVNLAVLCVNGVDIPVCDEGREGVHKAYRASRTRYALLTTGVSLLEGALLVAVVKLLELYLASGGYMEMSDYLADVGLIIVPVAALIIGAIASAIGLAIHSKQKNSR
jgi:hypothetical protein